MIFILFLSMTLSIFSNKEEMREVYPEIWTKLEEINYKYGDHFFLLEDNAKLVYCEGAKQDQFLCLNQNYNLRVSSIYLRPICGLHLEHF